MTSVPDHTTSSSAGGSSPDEAVEPTAAESAAAVGPAGTPATSDTKSLARSSAVMAAGTIVSRVGGVGRAILLAAVVGTTGLTADAFGIANTLPNQFYLLLAGGVLNAVLVPQITKAASHDDGGHEYVNRLLTLSIALMLGATVVVTLAAPLLVLLTTGGWSSQARSLAMAFAFICLPQIFFYGLYTLLGQVLNARGRFAGFMWAPALANVVAIGGMLVFLALYPRKAPVDLWTPGMVWLLAGTATLSIVAQALVLLIPLRRSGFRYRPVWGFRGVGLRSASTVAMWTFAAVAVSQLAFLITTRVLTGATNDLVKAHATGAGQAAYGYAFLLFMLPHSLVTVSLVTALFTRMSTSAHAGRTDEVVEDLGRGLRLPAVILVPASVAGLVLGPLAVRCVFLGNPRAETDAIAHVMMAMLVGLVPFGILYLLQRVYYAYEDARTPFFLQLVVTSAAMAANVVAVLLSARYTGVVVGIGQTVGNLAAALLAFWLLRRRLGPLHLAPTVRMYSRMLLASLIAGLVIWPLQSVLLDSLGDGFGARLLTLCATLGVFVVVSLSAAHLLRVREVSELLAPLLRRARRGTSAGTSA